MEAILLANGQCFGSKLFPSRYGYIFSNSICVETRSLAGLV